MPFTPFHLGPGAAIKAVIPRHFSLFAFALTQVLIDLESLYNLVYRKWPVHAFFHTYVGATLVALAAVVLSWFSFNSWLWRLNALLKLDEKSRIIFGQDIGWRPLALGAFIGAYSHVFLDSIMHADIEPLSPFSDLNVLHHVISMRTLHGLCVLAAAVGFVCWLYRVLVSRSRIDRS